MQLYATGLHPPTTRLSCTHQPKKAYSAPLAPTHPPTHQLHTQPAQNDPPPCAAAYHDECISLWLERKRTCPICKARVTSGTLKQAQRPATAAGSAWARQGTCKSTTPLACVADTKRPAIDLPPQPELTCHVPPTPASLHPISFAVLFDIRSPSRYREREVPASPPAAPPPPRDRDLPALLQGLGLLPPHMLAHGSTLEGLLQLAGVAGSSGMGRYHGGGQALSGSFREGAGLGAWAEWRSRDQRPGALHGAGTR